VKKPSLRTFIDLADRVGATFAQAFLAVITVGSFTDLKALKVAAVAGGYAVAKYLFTASKLYLSRTPDPAAASPPK
jgi:FMN-dependent NADH-azoreductase